MCGRYQLQASADAVASSHRNTSWRPGHSARYYPRQQFRPTNQAPVVVAKRPTAPTPAPSGDVEIVIMKWGMSPAWSSQQGRPPLINARRETLLRLSTFRRPLTRKDGSRRCAVPTTGFYEWHKAPGPGKPTLTPYLVQRSHCKKEKKEGGAELGNIMYMAGIYDEVGDGKGDDEFSFVIITTEACKQFQWLHDRQPVFLSSEKEVDCWLDNGVTAEEAVAELRTENGLSWTRMVKDLSEAAKGKAMVQRGLDSFFGKKGATKIQKDGKRKETVSGPKSRQKAPVASLNVAGGIRKKEKGASKGVQGKQKSSSSFF